MGEREAGRTMKAGRKLDRNVAALLGWQVVETDDCNGEDNFWLSKDGQNVYRGKYGSPLDLPHYSTDLAAAWLVVERIKSDMQLSRHARRDLSGLYDYGCFFYLEKNRLTDERSDGRTAPDPWHYAETAPLAICRAALAARATDRSPDGSLGQPDTGES